MGLPLVELAPGVEDDAARSALPVVVEETEEVWVEMDGVEAETHFCHTHNILHFHVISKSPYQPNSMEREARRKHFCIR